MAEQQAERLRVAHMIDLLKIGGAQKLLVMFASHARTYGLDLAVICLNPREDTPIVNDLEALGIPLYFFPTGRLIDLPRLSKLVRLLRSGRFRLLHTHLTYANINGALAGRMANVPVVATLHSSQPFKKSAQHRLEMLALRRLTARVIAVAEAVAEAYRPWLKNATQLTVIPNAVEKPPSLTAGERAALRSELVGDPQRPLVLSVGRLTEAKGYHDLLEAFAQVRAHYPQAALVIAGSGSLRADLEHGITRLGLAGNAILLGPRGDVPRLMASADIYACASHWEGLPLALLEAMAAGLPVVATRVGEIPSIINEEIGLLVEPHRPDELAGALQQLLASEEQRRQMGVAGREAFRSSYDSDIWMEQTLAVYREVWKEQAG